MIYDILLFIFFFSSRRRHTRCLSDWSSDVCSSDLNTLSLFGLILAIGLVVDDAIVVVEAVEHHIEHGMAPREATLLAMRQVSGTVIGVACVLDAVFLPTVFLMGITGR